MTKADFYMKEAIENILTNGYIDVNPRPHYADGTPAHTLSVNHVFRTYDLSNGEFPICTLRPMAWKTGIKELFAIYQNQSNKISEFERCGCGWWKDWELEDGTIGKAYPYNLESHRPNEMKKNVIKVKRRFHPAHSGNINVSDIPVFEGFESIDNTIYMNRYRIIGIDEERTDEKHTYYKIQFITNNYISSMRKDLIGHSNGVNPYDRTVYNVGYLGEYEKVNNFAEREIEILKDKWENMFRRCYSTTYQNEHHTYKNTFVHHEWHSFENFLRDVRMLPQYFLAREDDFIGWDLDKDYYASNCYSKDTCVFLKHCENSLYAKSTGCYEITDTTNNTKRYEINITDFAKSIGKKQSHVDRGIHRSGKYRNFTFEHLDNTNEYVYRYELSRNQVVELIKDIQNNPYGRRHIISFWHWANIDKKSLVECAYETIWNVRNDGNGNEYLDMCLIQRSGDMLTASGAGGINEIQYAALLMMIARHCGYKAGVFSHFVANEQIYDRHEEAAKEMINRFNTTNVFRELKSNPQLILNSDKTNFYDMTIEDFTMNSYEPIKPQLKLELGI